MSEESKKLSVRPTARTRQIIDETMASLGVDESKAIRILLERAAGKDFKSIYRRSLLEAISKLQADLKKLDEE